MGGKKLEPKGDRITPITRRYIFANEITFQGKWKEDSGKILSLLHHIQFTCQEYRSKHGYSTYTEGSPKKMDCIE